jgi:hypothetical protein
MNTNSKEWMLECEAREWVMRYKKKRQEVGRSEAAQWWTDMIAGIEKRRGKPAADELRRLMNKEKK